MQQNSFELQPSGEPMAQAPTVHRAPVATGSLGTRTCSPQSIRASTGSSIGRWALLFLVRAYIVFLSPFFGGACKFYPSCSNYAREAIERHGPRQGTVLALKRLLRCHPFTRGGIDLVPDELSKPPRATRNAHAHLAASGQGKAQ